MNEEMVNKVSDEKRFYQICKVLKEYPNSSRADISYESKPSIMIVALKLLMSKMEDNKFVTFKLYKGRREYKKYTLTKKGEKYLMEYEK